MGKVEKDKIAKIIPNRADLPSLSLPTYDERIAQGFEAVKAREKARTKYNELKDAQEREERVALAAEVNLDTKEIINPEDLTQHQIQNIAVEQKRQKEVEALIAEASPVIDVVDAPQNAAPGATAEVIVPSLSQNKLSQTLALQGAAKADVVKLLNSLNINLNVQLTKADTANLLACLLTCNESQLQALLTNKKVPIVIKTVIRRLLDDSNKGNMDAIEKLWDRVFGKGPMTVNMPEESLNKSLIPNMPVSREAYILIRDTLMK